MILYRGRKYFHRNLRRFLWCTAFALLTFVWLWFLNTTIDRNQIDLHRKQGKPLTINHNKPNMEYVDKNAENPSPLEAVNKDYEDIAGNDPERVQGLPNEIQQTNNDKNAEEHDGIVSNKVITFYYPWYGNLEFNGKWMHWNHKVLVDNGAEFKPPDDIGANFYPLLGPYSSIDPDIIQQHMKMISENRIGIICLSWWGKQADEQLKSVIGYTDTVVPLLLAAAHQYNIKVCFHHEPYEGRTPSSVFEDIKYVIDSYGNHPALFRWKEYGNRPLFFVYDSYLTKKHQWATILRKDAKSTIRGTEYDSIMIALYVDAKDRELAIEGHFDGVYTYFASNGFTVGSTTSNWKSISSWAKSNGKLFIPSVGPGYDDTRIRPWNARNRKDRRDGKYYDEMWAAALASDCSMISITSFNEWHEGTQIEPSVPKRVGSYQYSDFSPLEPDYYLKKSKEWIDKYDPLPIK